MPDNLRRERYLIELLETTARFVERMGRRMDHEYREDVETLQLILRELKKIAHELEPPPPPAPPPLTARIAVRFTGDFMADNALVFNVGQTSTASIQPRLADGAPSGGAVSNVSFSFSDPSATVRPYAELTGKREETPPEPF